MAPGVGLEPTANWLTANCSTTELPRNMNFFAENAFKQRRDSIIFYLS